jgi:hypothetical protein
MFHISDLRQYLSCPRILWLNQKSERQTFNPFIQMIHSMNHDLIIKTKATNYFVGRQGMTMDESIEALSKHEWCFNLRFEANGLRIKVAGLHKTEEGFELYFNTMSVLSRVEDASYFSNHFWVLKQNGITVTKIFSMYFNKEYIRQGELSVEDCYCLTSNFIKPSGHIQGDILSIVTKRERDLETNLNEMNRVIKLDDYPITLDECPNPLKCEKFGICFKDLDLGENSIYHFSNPMKKEWLKQGITKIQDIPLDDLVISKAQYAQIMVSRFNGRFVDKRALSIWIDKVKKPVMTFIDFEWDTYGIPPFDSMHPFDVMPFQYSIHFIEDNLVHHREFLGQGDCREAFIVSLLEHIPSVGPIIAYNAFGAEAIRLKQLAAQFPQYNDDLINLIDRFIDLAQVFIDGLVYEESMKGAYSLKRIIEAIHPELSYENLAISHGMDAVYHYRNLVDDEEADEVKAALLSYCRMDTLAMVKIFQWLETLI